MRFTIKKNRIRAVNDDNIGSPKLIAEEQSEPFPSSPASEHAKRRFQHSATMQIATVLTDSYYKDSAEEKDEWRSQMEIFADAYAPKDDPSFTEEGKLSVNTGQTQSRAASFIVSESDDKGSRFHSSLLRTFFGDTVKSPRAIRKTTSWNSLLSFEHGRGFIIHPMSPFR